MPTITTCQVDRQGRIYLSKLVREKEGIGLGDYVVVHVGKVQK